MSKDAILFLALRRLPARLTAEQAAWLLGCQPQHMSLLVTRKQVKYLGNPVQSATKYFALADVQGVAESPEKMAKITEIIYKYWKEKNSRRKKGDDFEYSEAA